MIKKWAMLAGLVLLMSPAAARADWLFTPSIGSTFGNGAGFTYGASIGWVGDGKFGWEFEFASTPGILGGNVDDAIELNPLVADDLDLLDDGGFSYMFNAVVGGPRGGSSNHFRPYFSGGLGWVSTSIESDVLLFEDNSTKFAFNLGGGVMTYFRNVGLRGDVRYYQTLSEEEFNDDLGLEIGDYDFWRATVGVTFRW
jgi:hypothetical protein